jgi:ribosomal protein S13
MTYVEENIKKLKELKKLPYKELYKMRNEIKNNPNASRADVINICVACGEVEIDQNIGRTYTMDEIEREFNIGKYRVKTKC